MLRAKPRNEKTEKQKLKAILKEHTVINRLNVEIPNTLYKQMQRCAIEEGRSISLITRELWKRYLKDQDHDRSTRQKR